MEDKISADLISKNLSELEEALKKKGYAFNSRVQVISKPLDLVKDVLDLESKAVDLKRYTFDIRT
jgi:thermostable 8-oxoguanine DNA glycosylase